MLLGGNDVNNEPVISNFTADRRAGLPRAIQLRYKPMTATAIHSPITGPPPNPQTNPNHNWHWSTCDARHGGNYTFNVEVRDGRGGSTQDAIEVQVPQISSSIVIQP